MHFIMWLLTWCFSIHHPRKKTKVTLSPKDSVIMDYTFGKFYLPLAMPSWTSTEGLMQTCEAVPELPLKQSSWEGILCYTENRRGNRMHLPWRSLLSTYSLFWHKCFKKALVSCGFNFPYLKTSEETSLTVYYLAEHLGLLLPRFHSYTGLISAPPQRWPARYTWCHSELIF